MVQGNGRLLRLGPDRIVIGLLRILGRSRWTPRVAAYLHNNTPTMVYMNEVAAAVTPPWVTRLIWLSGTKMTSLAWSTRFFSGFFMTVLKSKAISCRWGSVSAPRSKKALLPALTVGPPAS